MAQQRILVVDDEAGTRDLLCRLLSDAGYAVTDTFNAEEAIALLHREPFDLVTLDVMMPHVDGFECCRRIRQFSNVPVLFVTGRAESFSEVIGLEAGADDYITKPFHADSVVSRVRAVLRRSASQETVAGGGGAGGTTLIGPLQLDLKAQEAYVQGRPLGLTNKEFELLQVLVQNCGQIVGREELCNQVWGPEFDAESKTLGVHVYRLRKKMDDAGDLGRYVITKRQRGYMLSPVLRQLG